MNPLPISVRDLFDAAKSAGYQVKPGRLQVMLWCHGRKVGGWNTKESHWYVSKVMAADHRELMNRYGFRWMERNDRRHCWWQIDQADSTPAFQAVAEALTGVPILPELRECTTDLKEPRNRAVESELGEKSHEGSHSRTNGAMMFLKIFEEELRLGQNRTCTACPAAVKHPFLPFHVGREWSQACIRPLFVGKSPRAAPQEGHMFESGCAALPDNDLARDCEQHWPYWRYTRLIAEQVFGGWQQGWDRIALSNIVKCTMEDVISRKQVPPTKQRQMVDHCAGKLGVIGREIEQLKPTHIVFYTYTYTKPDGELGKTLQEVRISGAGRWHTVKAETRDCGANQLGWWTMKVDTPWAIPMHILVTNHPERKKKKDFTSLVVDWLTSSRVRV